MKTNYFAALASALLIAGCAQNPVEVTEVKVTPTSAQIAKGETVSLTAEVLPDNAEDKTVTWVSSAPEVAQVDAAGTVTGIENGSATITASCGDKSAFCTVTVDATDVESVTITPASVELIEGETATLTAEVLPEDAEDKTVTWESLDESIAIVDQTGKVTAVKPGKTKIMATCASKGATCDVTVSGKPVESVTVAPTQASLKSGEQKQLTATVLPEDAEDKTVTWESSDESIATVDETGLVTAVAVGTATITAKSGEQQGTCEVTVINRPALGDFYYSDGTWSTELDKSKTPIGIVFYVGDPSVDDATLRKEHPECKNGLVVSINGEKNTAWQPNFYSHNNLVSNWIINNTDFDIIECGLGNDDGDRLNLMVGYNNTKAIESFNLADENSLWPIEAVKSIDEYRTKVPTPDNSSSWYLPSPKEVSLLCYGETDKNIHDIYSSKCETTQLINEKLGKIENSQLLDGILHTSSESRSYRYGSVAVDFCITLGTVSFLEKTFVNENSRARYILAF